jgi:hypothetical protein
MALRMPDEPTTTAVCVAAATVPCRLVLRDTTPGKTPAWPMLVADPCPWPATDKFGNRQHHAHVHFLTSAAPLIRRAPCCRLPYLLTIARPTA